MDFFFVTGMGRSGTRWISELLNEAQGVVACHEYIGGAHFARLSWYVGDSYTEPYLRQVRRRVEEDFSCDYFADVNGQLRGSVSALRSVFDPREIFHLVRHPRDVVRSLYTRRSQQRTPILPKQCDLIRDWVGGDKFTQVCLDWAGTTELLISQGTKLIRFEDVLNDFSYLQTKVLAPLDLTIAPATWHAAVTQRVNPTRSAPYRWLYAKIRRKAYVSDRLPAYDEWPRARKQEFHRICGEAMLKAGYV
jgi:hypothetical protein